MTLKLNSEDPSTAAARKAGIPFLGMLLSLGSLLSLFQPVIAAPRHGNPGGPVYTVTTPVNFQLANNSAQDQVVVNISPTPSPTVGITFIINGGAGGDPVIPTDVNGNAILELSSPIATSFPVEAEIVDPFTHSVTVIGTVTVTFVAGPGPVDPAVSSIQIIINPALADGTSQDIVEAFLYDQYGNPEPSGTPVTFSIQTGTATITTTGVTTGNACNAFFTSTVVGFVQVQASAGGGYLYNFTNPSLNYVTIQFVVLPPSAANSYLTAVTTPEPADGSSQDVVQAVVLNSLGQPVPAGTAVTFTVETGTATITTTGITNASGVATAFFTSTVAGSVQVQAQVSINGLPTYLNDQANPGNNFVTIQFVVPPPSLANSYVVAVTTPQPADGVSQDVVQAMVLNALGQPVPAGTAVTFTIETGTATLTTTGITNASGVATAFFTSTVAGTVQVQAQISIGGVPTYLDDQASPGINFVTIQFVIPPPSAANSYVVAVTTPEPADGSSQDVVQAVVLNSVGQPVTPGTLVTFTIETGTATITTTGITNASGVATAFFTSTVVGAVQVQAQVSINGVPTYLNDQANPGNNYVTIQFVAGPPVISAPGIPVPPGGGGGSGGSGTGPSSPSDPTGPGQGYTYLTMTFNDVPADGVSTDTATAYITDAQGHPVSGVPVTFSFHTGGPANGGALFQPGNVVTITVLTNSNGYAAVPITDTIAGDAWVDASINVGGVPTVINGSSAIAVFMATPDVSNPVTQLIVVVYEALADGLSTTTVEAQIVDVAGNPIAGASVQFAIDSGSAQFVGSQPVLTDANGDAIINLTSTTVGYALVTATVNGKAIIFGSPARVEFAGINIYVPRAFSPNGDGVNDLLKPILVGIQTFQYFTVYNRWGNIVFTTTDANQGWDGTFKGVPQPVESYLWIAQGIDTNGKKIVAKGMTSLVR
jgi:gliding motility-associated-like protein